MQALPAGGAAYEAWTESLPPRPRPPRSAYLLLLCSHSNAHQTSDLMPSGRKRKRHKIATHKRKKRLRKNRHKKKGR